MKIKYFDLARRLSYKSDHHTHKLGCVIVKRSRIVGVGFNKLKTHPKSNHEYRMVHAEISALIGIPREDLEGCHAYVYREIKDGTKALAKPCATCEAALREAGIEKVFYTSTDGYDHRDLGE